MSATANSIKNLADQIRATFPGATTDVEDFPSGAAVLDVRWRGRALVLVFTPSGGFGVDELGSEEGFETGYAFSSEDFTSASEEMLRRLRVYDGGPPALT